MAQSVVVQAHLFVRDDFAEYRHFGAVCANKFDAVKDAAATLIVHADSPPAQIASVEWLLTDLGFKPAMWHVEGCVLSPSAVTACLLHLMPLPQERVSAGERWGCGAVAGPPRRPTERLPRVGAR